MKKFEMYFDYVIFAFVVALIIGFLFVGFWYFNAGPGVDTFKNVNNWIYEQLKNLD